MLNQKHKAFTLVELIVVIVILAILATIAFLSFSSQSWSARDSTRLADISSIKKSVEMYNVNAWTYPTPDNPYSYTYSGWVIWNQWTIWDSAYKMLQKNLSKKVVDPLKWSEYDYSLASNKREYQVAWNFENPTSFERNYNPFDSSVLSPKLSALGWTGANVYISWNYNWVMLKVFTWSTYYFVPTPTLFWIWTWSTVYDNTFWSWKDLLPWVNNVAVFDSSKVYASTSSTGLSAAEVTALMNTVQLAYSGWNVTTPAVQAVLAATWSALTDLWVWLVKNSLGGGTSSVWGGWSVLIPKWDSASNPWINCLDVKDSWVVADWVYWVKPDSNPAYQTYCSSSDGGGWTLVMRGKGWDIAWWNTTGDLNLANSLSSTWGTFKLADSTINSLAKTKVFKLVSDWSFAITRYVWSATWSYNHLQNAIANGLEFTYSDAGLTLNKEGEHSDRWSTHYWISDHWMTSAEMYFMTNHTSATWYVWAHATNNYCGWSSGWCNFTMWVR